MSQQSQVLDRFTEDFLDFITYIFSRRTSAFYIIRGRRESGKTDFALLIAEAVYYSGVIRNIATNIKIYEAPFSIEYITNLMDLEHWCSTCSGKKLYILDEAGKSFRRRTPLSKLNIKLLDKIQILRKYKLSLIFITPHEAFIDSAIWGTDVLDGVFTKSHENPKIALYDDYLESFTKNLYGIPPTTIKFDTWDVAPFTEKPTLSPRFRERDLQILWEWSHGKSFKELGLHPMQLNRLVRKFVKQTLENSLHTSHKDDDMLIDGKKIHKIHHK